MTNTAVQTQGSGSADRAALLRGKALGALLNWIRAAKVRSAADLATLSDIVADPGLKLELARHAAVEAQHGYLLIRRMAELGLSPVRPPAELNGLELLLDGSRARDVKQAYSQSTPMADADLMEVVVALWLWHRRASVKLWAYAERPRRDAETSALLQIIADDEQRHGAYLGQWREWFEKRFSRRAVAAVEARLETILDRFAETCLRVLEDGWERPAA
jgi:hypothetical protein